MRRSLLRCQRRHSAILLSMTTTRARRTILRLIRASAQHGRLCSFGIQIPMAALNLDADRRTWDVPMVNHVVQRAHRRRALPQR
jgi:hypothetical protein